MKPFDLYIVHVSWGEGGKRRPVLVYTPDNRVVSVYPITTQYENKSEAVRMRFFKINDGMQAGLDKQSYVDTGTRLIQPLSMFAAAAPVGTLTAIDKRRLLEFLKSR